jgi:hypothetical protein
MKTTITEQQAYEIYDDMLDDCYGMIDVCGYKYDASTALKRIDPIAYNVGFSDYIANCMEEDGYEIEGY